MSANDLAKVIHMDEARGLSPQLEDGYVRIANELFDALLRFKPTGRQWAVLMAVIRKTYGFGKKVDDISASQIGAICDVSRNHVTETLHQLHEMNVITLERGSYGMLVGVNKHHREWKKPATSPGKGLVPKVDSPSPKSGQALVPKVDRSIVPNRDTQKTTFQKTTSKDNTNIAQSRDCADDAFEKFWEAFDYKKGRKKARETFIAKRAKQGNKDEWLERVLLAAMCEARRRPSLVTKGGTPKFAQGWLNDERYEDEDLIQWGRFTPAQQKFVAIFNDSIGDLCAPVSDWSPRRAALVESGIKRSGERAWWEKFWLYVRDECEFRGSVSFDWIMDDDNFARIKSGDFERVDRT